MSALASDLQIHRVDVQHRESADPDVWVAEPVRSVLGPMRAARRLLSAWLQRCLRQGAAHAAAPTVPVPPVRAIERHVDEAIGHAAGESLAIARDDLIGGLRGLVARIVRRGEAGGAEPGRLYDQAVEGGLTALQQLAEIEVELTARQAWTDPLTGLPGRRALQQRLISEHALLRRHASPSVLVLLDLDRFKPVNDRWGHLVGDRYLAAFARALQAGLRPYDAAFRYGGDEFVLLLPRAGVEQARAVVERLRRDMVATPLINVDGHALYASFSAGLAPLESGRSIVQTIGEADAMLYAAKAATPRAS